MALLAASYDVLLGYAGIVSFAHVMFFGVGSYGVGLALYALGPGWGALALGAGGGLALAALLALAIGLFSLRVQAIFFAMVTLAVAYAFNVLASQLSDITGGEDGRSFRVPEVLRPGFKLSARSSACRSTAGCSAIISCSSPRVALFLVLLRVVNSPFGRVLQAIRENPLRAEALGYRIVFHRTLATCLAAAGAAAAGALNALWLRYVGPDTALAFSIQIDVLVDRRHRRHGHALRRGGRRGVVRHRAELSAGADRRAFAGAADAGLPLLPACCTPTAGCCGSACCSCSRSISRRPGIVGALRPRGRIAGLEARALAAARATPHIGLNAG